MSPSPGSRLGPYEVTALLGEGGMGAVYRGRDTKLNRDVALKVLLPAVADDPERLARFRREAQTLAALNHPNIAAIYGIEESPDTTALVMELVEGEDLSALIARGPLSPSTALPIARQIAEALEAAHEQGIIHRDLKPANVKVRNDGTVKVLDFGLAKAVEPVNAMSPSASQSPTITSPAMTQMGMILGTAAYMAPEQARGRPVDKRADIWAFGCVLFEMLTGQRVFEGDDVSSTLARVLEREPAFELVPASVPSTVQTVLRRCLQKDPRQRARDIGDVRLALEGGFETPPDVGHPSGAASLTGRRSLRSYVWPTAFVIAAVTAAALAVVLADRSERSSSGAPLRRFVVTVPWEAAPNWNDFGVAISRDGSQIAYNCRDGNTVSMCVRALDSLTVSRIADGRDARTWSFSPDGAWVAIADEVGLSKVSIRGGQPQVLHRWLDSEHAPTGFSWGPDNTILYGSPSGLRRVPASGGSPDEVTRIDATSGTASHEWPSYLPDGRHALFTIVGVDGTETAAVVDLGDGSVHDLGTHGRGFTYVAPGWLAFQQGETILAVEFDAASLTVGAAPVPVLQNVRSMPRVALDGTLVYIPTRGESTARLVWVDRAGQATPADDERLDYTHMDLAPDGRRALLNLDVGRFGEIDLIDLPGGTRKVVAQGGFPIWSEDGRRVTFTGPAGIERVAVDGSTPAEVLVPHSGFVVATSWNSVTGDLAYYDHRSFEIWTRAPDGRTRRFLDGRGRKRSGRFSPDGRWLAFVSDETGEYQVYVAAYPGPGPTIAVSTKGGLSPIWSADGKELFFRLGSKTLMSRLSSTEPPTFTTPVELFDGPYTLDLMGHQREDVSPDGRRFLMVENSDDFPIVLVQSWALELERLTSR